MRNRLSRNKPSSNKNQSSINLNGRLNGGNFNYSIKLEAGKTYSFCAQADDPKSNLGMRLIKGQSSIIKNADDSPGSSDPRFKFTAPQTGFYTIQVYNQKQTKGASNQFKLVVDDTDSSPASTARIVARRTSITRLADKKLNTIFNSLIQDQELDFKDLQTLLSSVGSGSGMVTEAELKGLRQVANGLANYVNPSKIDYYGYLFDAVVYGNPANQFWTGGQQGSTRLGDLKARSSKDHLQKLIGKWFRGDDLPESLIEGDIANNKEPEIISYDLATGPIFDGPTSYTDMFQGNAGTCYFLAAAASIANANPAKIESSVTDNGDGTYGVKFYSSGSSRHPLWVTVNRMLPIKNHNNRRILSLASGNKDYSPDKKLWPALLEKAYAQANEIGQFEERGDRSNSYQAIEGGFEEALGHISGSSYITPGREIGDSIVNPNAFVETYKDKLTGALTTRQAAITASYGETQIDGKIAFTVQHMYAIIDYKPESNKFLFFNPWGVSDNGAHMGTFSYSLKDALQITSNEMNEPNFLAWTL